MKLIWINIEAIQPPPSPSPSAPTPFFEYPQQQEGIVDNIPTVFNLGSAYNLSGNKLRTMSAGPGKLRAAFGSELEETAGELDDSF